jgi:hypothetical protein
MEITWLYYLFLLLLTLRRKWEESEKKWEAFGKQWEAKCAPASHLFIENQ